jgi:hypothetical protein
MPRTIRQLDPKVQALLQVPLPDLNGDCLSPVDLHTGLAYDMAMLFATVWTHNTDPGDLIGVLQRDHDEALRLFEAWYQAARKGMLQGIDHTALWKELIVPTTALQPFFDVLGNRGGLRDTDPPSNNRYDSAADDLREACMDLGDHMGIPPRTVLMMILVTVSEGFE